MLCVDKFVVLTMYQLAMPLQNICDGDLQRKLMNWEILAQNCNTTNSVYRTQILGIFLFTIASRTALGPTQPPIQWVPGALSLGLRRPGREAVHSPPSSAEVKECVGLYLHSPIRLHGVVLSWTQEHLYRTQIGMANGVCGSRNTKHATVVT
jgi:hypothetical protein